MLGTMIAFLSSAFLSDGGLVPLLLAVIALSLLMLSLRRKQRRIQHDPDRTSSVREPPPAPKKAELRRDIEDLLVELQDLSRKISAEIDTRFAKLEAAIHDADRRIAALQRLTRQAQKQAVNKTNNSAEPDDRHSIVYELADAGHTPVEIAKDLGKTPGEIELILNLRKSAQKKLS